MQGGQLACRIHHLDHRAIWRGVARIPHNHHPRQEAQVWAQIVLQTQIRYRHSQLTAAADGYTGCLAVVKPQGSGQTAWLALVQPMSGQQGHWSAGTRNMVMTPLTLQAVGFVLGSFGQCARLLMLIASSLFAWAFTSIFNGHLWWEWPGFPISGVYRPRMMPATTASMVPWTDRLNRRFMRLVDNIRIPCIATCTQAVAWNWQTGRMLSGCMAWAVFGQNCVTLLAVSGAAVGLALALHGLRQGTGLGILATTLDLCACDSMFPWWFLLLPIPLPHSQGLIQKSPAKYSLQNTAFRYSCTWRMSSGVTGSIFCNRTSARKAMAMVPHPSVILKRLVARLVEMSFAWTTLAMVSTMGSSRLWSAFMVVKGMDMQHFTRECNDRDPMCLGVRNSNHCGPFEIVVHEPLLHGRSTSMNPPVQQHNWQHDNGFGRCSIGHSNLMDMFQESAHVPNTNHWKEAHTLGQNQLGKPWGYAPG